MRTRTFVLVAGLAAALPSAASAAGYIESFDDAATDPFFDFDFTSEFRGGSDFHEINGGSLALAPDEVLITFNTAPDEEVFYFQLILADFVGMAETQMEWIGTQGTINIGNFLVQQPETFTLTPGNGIGALVSLRISGLETFIYSIEAETRPIPTSGTLALLGAGGLTAIRRRR